MLRKIIQKTSWKIVLAVVLILAGFWLGRISVKDKNNYAVKELRQWDMKYTSPLLECEYGKKSAGPAFQLENEVKDKAEKISGDYDIENFSLYFRDLNNGPWFGINEKEEFTPASLLKVPLMIACFKKSESDPEFLNQKFVFKNKARSMVSANIKSDKTLEDGKEYTYEEAIEIMIQESDNRAAEFLLEKIDSETLGKVYLDLGLKIPTVEKSENFMTVKDYASFFRILYNASYLNKVMSEKALGIMTGASFKSGLRSGIPEPIDIAHKFGEREFEGKKQLHDCGIIYYPDYPFILCVMTRGNDFGKMQNAVRDISKFVYEKFDEQIKSGKN